MTDKRMFSHLKSPSILLSAILLSKVFAFAAHGQDPLIKTVADLTKQAAKNDFRFNEISRLISENQLMTIQGRNWIAVDLQKRSESRSKAMSKSSAAR